ncbi:glycosyltransferase [Acetobacter sp. UBA5411]|uniref:glycosyltransferase n=1 Tax=Acetobacter sp. UBA5411 TaxID=1945905 RepID=UPI0025B82A76|nr:glycosyltransferase [Acetobacter sp. UBA5411]
MTGPLYRAFLDRADRYVSEGWARNETDPFTPVPLTVFRDGVQVAELAAESWREDLVEPGHSDGYCAFRHVWLPPLPENDFSRIEVRLPNGEQINGSPVFVPAPTDEQTVLGVRGAIDIFDHERIAGWIRDEDRPERAVGVAILLDGQEVAFLKANSFRRDLRDLGLGSGRYGFEFLFASPPDPLTAHTVEIRPDTGAPFPEGAKVLPAAEGFFDQAMMNLASREIGGLRDVEKIRTAADFLASCLETLRKKDAEGTLGLASRREIRRLRRQEGNRAVTVQRQVLVIDDQIPDVRRDAASVALLSHMKALQVAGLKVFFTPSLIPGCREDVLASLAEQGITVLRPPLWESVEAILRQAGEAFDLIYLHRLGNASAYLELARRLCPMARIIWSVADIDSLRLRRQAQVEQRPELTILAAQSEARERMVTWRSNVVITHSDEETTRIREGVPSCAAVTVRWAVPVGRTVYRPAKRDRIVFLGHFGHAPNRDAVRWLATEIVPALRRLNPALEITVFGSGMTAETLSFACDGLTFAGYAPEIGTVFAQARLMVAPLRFGAGIKGKILESWSHGVPVLMTPMAAESLPLLAGQRSCVAPAETAAFVAGLAALWADEEALKQQSALGRKLLRTSFSEKSVEAEMALALSAAFAEKGMKSESL